MQNVWNLYKECSSYSVLASEKELRKLDMVDCIALFLLKYEENGKNVMVPRGKVKIARNEIKEFSEIDKKT